MAPRLQEWRRMGTVEGIVCFWLRQLMYSLGLGIQLWELNQGTHEFMNSTLDTWHMKSLATSFKVQEIGVDLESTSGVINV